MGCRVPAVAVQRREDVVGQASAVPAAGPVEPGGGRLRQGEGGSSLALGAQHLREPGPGEGDGAGVAAAHADVDRPLEARPAGAHVPGLLLRSSEVDQVMCLRGVETERGGSRRRSRRGASLASAKRCSARASSAEEALGMGEGPVVAERAQQRRAPGRRRSGRRRCPRRRCGPTRPAASWRLPPRPGRAAAVVGRHSSSRSARQRASALGVDERQVEPGDGGACVVADAMASSRSARGTVEVAPGRLEPAAQGERRRPVPVAG